MNQMIQPTVDLSAAKAKQRATWGAGDYAIVGTTLQIVGEQLCETIDLRAGSKVLDVAAGNGNATLAAARHYCDVTSTDYVESLLNRSKERAVAERAQITYQVGDVESLSFDDGAFDVTLSTFGVMFCADHDKAASELLRVTAKGGTIAMANWTPTGFIGRLFKTIGAHIPPAPGVKSPALWGTEEAITDMFGDAANTITLIPRKFVFRYLSPEHFVRIFATYYGPTLKAFEALGARAPVLEADILSLIDELNVATDRTVVIPADYVDVVIRKA